MSRFVLVTRHPAECREFQSMLAPAGLTVRPYPVLRLLEFADEEEWERVQAAAPAGRADAWLALASPRAPMRFAAVCRTRGAEHLLRLPAAAVGEATARAAAEAGLRVELVGPGTGGGLGERMLGRLAPASVVVFVCGRDVRPELPVRLTGAGHTVLPLTVYRMEPTPPRELPPLGPSLEAVVLTSPRAAELYLRGVGGLPLPCPHWAIGPTTRDAAAALGIDCHIPREPTLASLAEELCTI